jgi:beta-glucosidase
MILEPLLQYADAIVVAWLPGSEGGGVADVLVGDFKPTGKLPHSWPRNMTQIPINMGDATYDPLYPFGHGLTYP